MYDLKEKVAIITGGANGIGAATVRNFLKEGAKYVAILDINEGSGIALEREMAAKYGDSRVKFIKCDVANGKQFTGVFDKVFNEQKYVDVLINNAGIANETMDMYKKLININFTAAVTGTHKALELMRKDRGGRGGTVINCGSVVSLHLVSPTLFVYAATKSALHMYGNTIGMEGYHSHTGVRVITMCFGVTSTNIHPISFDDDITENMEKNIAMYFGKRRIYQKVEVAADGIVEAYKKGESGSTWLVKEHDITDITERITKAYQIMSGELEL